MGISNRKGTVPLLDLLHKQQKPVSGSRSGDGHGNGTAAQGATPSNPLGKPVVRIELKPRDATRGLTPIKVQPLVLPGKPVEVASPEVVKAEPASIPSRSAHTHAAPHVIPAASAASMPLHAPSPLPTLVPSLSPADAAHRLDSPMTRPASEIAPAGVGISPALISKIAIGLLGLGVVALLLYVVGYRLGGSDKKKELEPILRANVPVVVEPKVTTKAPSPQPTRQAARETPAPAPQPSQPPARTQPRATGEIVFPTLTPGMFEDPAPPAGAILTSSGWLRTDPRQDGKNYLVLINRIARNDAGAAVLFFAENGVQAFAVPLDKSGALAKNPSRDFYALYAGPGFTSFQMKETDEDARLKNAVVRLGKAWADKVRGASSFEDAFFEKYTQ